MIVHAFNRLMNRLADAWMGPWEGESPFPALVAASALAAALLVAVFGLVSNPKSIRRARNRFLARSLELLLFRHDLLVSLTACLRIVAANFHYLGQFALPFLCSSVPVFLIYVQMSCWFESRPLRLSETAVVEVDLRPTFPVMQTPVTLQASDRIRLDSPGVRSIDSNSVAWRIAAISSGSGELEVQAGNQSLRKHITVSTQTTRISTRRGSATLSEQLLYPSEPPLPADGPVARVRIGYPERELWVGTTRLPWSLSALLLVMVFGVGFGKLLGVQLA